MFVTSGTAVMDAEEGAEVARASGTERTGAANVSSVATRSVASTHEASAVIAAFLPNEPKVTVSVALVYCTSDATTPTCGSADAS